MIYTVQENLRGAISLTDLLEQQFVLLWYKIIYWKRLWNMLHRLLTHVCLLFTVLLFMSRCSSPPGPPCSLLTSCSSWSCCYLKSRLVARVETPARLTMAECPPCPRPFWAHQPLPAWSPAWPRPSRVSSWVAWAWSHSQTLSLEHRCLGTSWICTDSISSSTT